MQCNASVCVIHVEFRSELVTAREPVGLKAFVDAYREFERKPKMESSRAGWGRVGYGCVS
jgi:hypothetical protein